jgi:hypothetical protein
MRFRKHGDLDDPPVYDKDMGWKALVSSLNANQLDTGQLKGALNIRLDKGVAKVRAGFNRVLPDTDRASLTATTLFDAIPHGVKTSDMDDIMVATNSKAFLWDRDSNPAIVPLDYSSHHTNPTYSRASLTKTFATTLLFSDVGPTLPFTLNNQSLGNPVLRYNGQGGFNQFKEVGLGSVSLNHVTTLRNHTLKPGERIRITGTGTTFDNSWKVGVVGHSSFSLKPDFNVALGTLPASATGGKVYSLDDGCPPAEFSAWAGNRLVVPTGNEEVRISDLHSTSSFPILKRLQVGGGESGNITALLPMADDSLLVFKHHSIYSLTGISRETNYDPATKDQLGISRLTDQLGCAARQTIQVVGDEVIFLSTHGVYALTLHPKGYGTVGLPPQAVVVADAPISQPIDDVIDEIDFNHSDSFSSVFNRGRYFLFVRLKDSSEVCLVYNTLLKAWESKDSLTTLQIKKLLAVNDSGGAELFALSGNGGLIKAHQSTDGYDYYGETDRVSITGVVTTRDYDFNQLDGKRCRRVKVGWKSTASGNSISGEFSAKEPDSTPKTLISKTSTGAEDFSFTQSARTRGQRFNFVFTLTGGTSELTSVRLEGRISDRQTFNTE